MTNYNYDLGVFEQSKFVRFLCAFCTGRQRDSVCFKLI